MKYVGAAISLVFVGWATLRVWGLPPRVAGPAVTTYLVAHALFTFLCCVWVQRIPPASSRYQMIYYTLLTPSLVVGAWLALSWCWTWPLNAAALLNVFPAAGLFLLIRHDSLQAKQLTTLPLSAFLLLLSAAVFYALGSMALLAAIPQQDEVTQVLRIGLGAFWLAQGIILFGFAHGRALDRMAWGTRIQWWPQIAAIAAFGWLAWTLGAMQKDEARRPAVNEVQMHVRTAEAATAMGRRAK